MSVLRGSIHRGKAMHEWNPSPQHGANAVQTSLCGHQVCASSQPFGLLSRCSRVADHEARAFFLRSGLSSADLSKVGQTCRSTRVPACSS